MAEASRVLASSMDYGETLQRVARLAVPQIADWCAVDLLNERGEIERVAVHHADPARLALAERLDRELPPGARRAGRGSRGDPHGEARIFTDIQPEALAAYAHDSEHLELLQRDRRDRGDHRADDRRAPGRSARSRWSPRSRSAGSRAADLGARRAARPPRGHGGRKRAPLHRAHPHRPHSPAGAAAGVAARDAGRGDRGALLARPAS